MPKFRKKPVEIEAVQLRWDTWNEVCEFIGPFPEGMRGVYVDEHGNPSDDYQGGAIGSDNARIGLLIPTLEGTMLAVQSDWIIRGVQGELYPCKPDIFEATYEPADEQVKCRVQIVNMPDPPHIAEEIRNIRRFGPNYRR